MDSEHLDTLVARALDGEELAENQLFQHLLVRFTRFAGRRVGADDADEPAQAACVIILEKYKKENFYKGFMPWAHGVFKNTLLKFMEKRRRDTRRLIELREETATSEQQPNPLFLPALHECIEKISRLSRRFAPILALIAVGETKGQICRRLDMSEGAFDTNYWRAREQLDECLENEGAGR